MNRGFTLIELLVIISIISLLAALAFTPLREARERGRLAEALLTAKQLGNAAALYESSLGFWPPDTRTGWDPGFQNFNPTDNGAGFFEFPQRYPYCLDSRCPSPAKGKSAWLASSGIQGAATRWESYTKWPTHTPWKGGYDYNYWGKEGAMTGKPFEQRCAWDGTSGICCETPLGVYIGIQPKTNPNTMPVGQVPSDVEKAALAKGADFQDRCYTVSKSSYSTVRRNNGESSPYYTPIQELDPKTTPNGEIQVLVTPL